MPNKLKELVSKKKIRYQQGGFDLDLTYITPRVIAMGFPAQSWEGMYRNHIDDVVSFFQKKHTGHYQIYNLCNERQINEQQFEHGSINHRYPFNDHNPPMFTQMIACCREIQEYLDQHEENVVAIQCKAGKGRTGVIVCACLLFQNSNWTATETLEFYGVHRTTNGKGVTIPSQIRFIYYFEHYLRKDLQYESLPLKLNYVALDEMPNIAGNGYELQFIIYVYDSKTKKLKVIHTSRFYEARKDGTRALKLFSDNDFIVSDDLKFQFILKSKFGKKENLCHCWLNTFFIVHKPPIQSFSDGIKDSHSSHTSTDNQQPFRKVSRLRSADTVERPKLVSPDAQVQGDNEQLTIMNTISPGDIQSFKLTLQKYEIDKANKDTNHKTFPFNFAITFFFENTPISNSTTAHGLVPPPIKTRSKNTGDLKKVNINKAKKSPNLLNINENKELYNEMFRNFNSPNNSDNPDDHSESSESSTKNSNSDFDDIL